MEGRQPFHCFDAVLGTTAIALTSPRDSSAIIRRVERALRSRIANATDGNDRLITEACLRSVHVAINEPSTAEDRTLLRGRRRANLAARDSKAASREIALFLVLDVMAPLAWQLATRWAMERCGRMVIPKTRYRRILRNAQRPQPPRWSPAPVANR
jgi:hypothetical protein